MKNYYIVLTDKKVGTDRIVARRETTLADINKQAAWMWSLLNRRERKRYSLLIQGEIQQGDVIFNSDKLP